MYLKCVYFYNHSYIYIFGDSWDDWIDCTYLVRLSSYIRRVHIFLVRGLTYYRSGTFSELLKFY